MTERETYVGWVPYEPRIGPDWAALVAGHDPVLPLLSGPRWVWRRVIMRLDTADGEEQSRWTIEAIRERERCAKIVERYIYAERKTQTVPALLMAIAKVIRTHDEQEQENP